MSETHAREELRIESGALVTPERRYPLGAIDGAFVRKTEPDVSWAQLAFMGAIILLGIGLQAVWARATRAPLFLALGLGLLGLGFYLSRKARGHFQLVLHLRDGSEVVVANAPDDAFLRGVANRLRPESRSVA